MYKRKRVKPITSPIKPDQNPLLGESGVCGYVPLSDQTIRAIFEKAQRANQAFTKYLLLSNVIHTDTTVLYQEVRFRDLKSCQIVSVSYYFDSKHQGDISPALYFLDKFNLAMREGKK